MRSRLVLLAEIIVFLLLFFLIIKAYTVWVWVALAIFIALLIYFNIKSTLVMQPLPFHAKELNLRLDFLDSTGERVHVTKEQLTKSLKRTAYKYVDRGIGGTGKINNFKSSVYIANEWQVVKTPLQVTVEGAELAVTTTFDVPLSHKIWIRRKFEFDCINCFLEKEESFVFRIDNPTELLKIMFVFNEHRRPDQINITKIMGAFKKELPEIRPSSIKREVFEWFIQKPPLYSEYLFLWKW